jgi:hypothetical protein
MTPHPLLLCLIGTFGTQYINVSNFEITHKQLIKNLKAAIFVQTF